MEPLFKGHPWDQGKSLNRVQKKKFYSLPFGQAVASMY